MGAAASIENAPPTPALTPRVLTSMQTKTRLTADELQMLGLHFQRYQLTDGASTTISTETATQPTGSIDRVKFQQAMGLPEKESLYIDRLFQVVDTNRDGRISFDEFCQSVSLLSTKTGIAEKTKLSFDILDIDGDGKVSKDELTHMLHTCLAENNISITKENIQVIIAKTFTELGAADDFVTYETYAAMVQKNEGMLSHLTLNLAYLLSVTGTQAALQAS